jgi:hypothetical protein
MISIRKFVGYAGAAAGISAAIALAMASQAVVAAAPSNRVIDQAVTMQAAPSAECTAALQAIKTAAADDRSEDLSEWAVAKTNPDTARDTSEDADELAAFKALFSTARTACAPAVAAAPQVTKFTPSAQCTADLQALKAAWQGGLTSKAQWTQLQALAQAARADCGWAERR